MIAVCLQLLARVEIASGRAVVRAAKIAQIVPSPGNLTPNYAVQV